MENKITRFQPLGRRVSSEVGSTLLDLAMDTDVPVESICGGAGKCGKCRVMVAAGSEHLSPPTENERSTLTKEEKDMGVRLACQTRVVQSGDIVVDVPELSRRGHHRLLASGIEPEVERTPAVGKILLRIPPATLEDIRADDDRLLEVLHSEAAITANISQGVHQLLPKAVRENSWEATVTLYRNEELIRIDPGDTTGNLLGVAVDLGTTKVVAYLVDLISGEILGTESQPNPQIPFGEDVMSRITYASRTDGGLRRLNEAIVNAVNALLARLCETAGKDQTDILEMLVVGNTAMHHIFFGITPEHLAQAPYAPAIRTAISVDPGHLGIDIYPFGKVSSLPNIAGFVGADAVAVLLASGLHDDEDIGMMIDIGTNTEIIAGNRGRLIGCSCASGPAFEGAHIKHGMRAASGAIERVWIDPSTMEVHLRTVDDAPARGICGSGIVDAISEMFRCRVIGSSGKLSEPGSNERVRRGADGKMEFVLVADGEAGAGTDITITQNDIQEIQLAKAAIFTGVSTLMKKLGIGCSDLKCVYAAGAFGTYVDATSAVTIGMYPDIPPERIKFVGNAAGSGARMALKSIKSRDLADRLSRRVEYIELAMEKDFQAEFAKAMFLPHRERERFPSVGAGTDA
jgi:uncharacterized 2Fe-2S/4Fe-4S cluster protein (DUF4445 family)